MTQTDIIIDHETSYNVCVGEANSYDIKILNELQSLDIVVSGLLSRYDIYGDELVPLVMYLKTSSEMVPYVMLLDGELGQTEEQAILLSLKSCCNGFENSTAISIEHQELSMLTSVDAITLNTSISTLLQNVGITCEAEVVAVSYISSIDRNGDRNGFKVDSYIDKNALITVYLKSIEHSLMSFDDMYLYDLDNNLVADMDIILSEAKLIQSKTQTYLQTSVEAANTELPVMHNISNMIFSTRISIVGRNISSLSTDAYLDRTIFLGDVKEEFELYETDRISTYISFYIYPKQVHMQMKTGMDFEYPLSNYDYYNINNKMDSTPISTLDNAADIIYLETFLSATGDVVLSSSASMIIEPSANYYGDYLLTSIDDYTLLELEAELSEAA